jgi:hypothetical protein
MIYGNAGACDLVGFPQQHGAVFQGVADGLDTVVMSRSVGKSCTQLIQEGYGLKGFRIDTKSCSWGPQMGLVCMDPRLNKEGLGKADFNYHKTREALSGEMLAHLSTPGQGEGAGWKADIVPIAISDARVTTLEAGVDGKRVVAHTRGDGFRRGISSHPGKEGAEGYGAVTFPWMLIQLPRGRDPLYGQIQGVVWGLFVDAEQQDKFIQQYPYPTVKPVWRKFGSKWYEAVLGLANPGSGSKGYKACVTGDYDLFGVWPKKTMQGRSHVRPSRADIRHVFHPEGPYFWAPSDYPKPREENWDARPVSVGKKEHWLLGNATQRINLVKVMLNTRLQADTAIPTFGQCVHHSDEVGNPNMELKKSLTESMPVIAFVPKQSRIANPTGSALQRRFITDRARRVTDAGAIGIESIGDMKVFARICIDLGFGLDLRPDWVIQLGL